MKAIFLTSVLAALFSISNINASNPRNKVYNNIENNKYGSVKEYTVIDNETSKATKKAVYIFDIDGILQEKTLYNWDDIQGWIGTQKYEYEYNRKKLSNIIYTKWDKEIATWSVKAEHLIHVYNTDGELLAVKHIQVNNDYNLMASK